MATGDDGDVMTLAHSIYGIGYRFLKEKIDMKKAVRCLSSVHL